MLSGKGFWFRMCYGFVLYVFFGLVGLRAAEGRVRRCLGKRTFVGA